MTCRQRTFHVFVVLLLLGGCGEGAGVAPTAPEDPLAAPVGADADKASLTAYRRDLLLREAERRFGSKEFKASDAVASLAALQDDEAFLAAFQPRDEEEKGLAEVLLKTIDGRRLMLGDAPPDAGNGNEAAEAPEQGEDGTPHLPQGPVGALLEAQRLLLWLRGDPSMPCRVFVRRVDGKGDVQSEEAYRWPPPPPPPPPEAAPESEKPADPPPPAEGGEAEKKEAAPAPPPAPEEAAPAPKVKDRMKAWAEEVVVEEKGLRGKEVQPGECSTVASLLSVAKTAPDYLPRKGLGLQRFPLASQTPFAYNRPYLALRRLQSAERVAAWTAEAGEKLLVDESTVRERARRAKIFEDQLAATQAERDGILEELDRIVDQVDRWEDVAAVLSGSIQEEQIRLEGDTKSEEEDPLAKPTEAAEAPRSPKLRVLEAQESSISMDVGLIYHTVLRAQERLGILDALLLLEELESHLAASRYRDYAAELSKVRSGRSLRRLQVARQRLVATQEVLEKDAPRPDSPQAYALLATKSLIELNDVVRQVVERRRLLNDLTTTRAAPKEDAATPASEEAKPEIKEDLAAEGPALHLVTKDVENQTWALETIENARADLEDPRLQGLFDADLVARHYRVASQQAGMLVSGLKEIKDAAVLGERYEELEVQVGSEIEKAGYFGRSLVKNQFEALKRSYLFAVDDLKNERRRFEDLLEATESYRRELLDQGARSLTIRIGNDVDSEDLLAAVAESAKGARSAVRWLSGEAEPNVVDWGSKAWLPILEFLALLGGVGAVVVFGRRRIDRWLSARAAKIPELRWVGASVRDEALAKQARERQEEEARKVTEEALRVPPPPPPAAPAAPPSEDGKETTP